MSERSTPIDPSAPAADVDVPARGVEARQALGFLAAALARRPGAEVDAGVAARRAAVALVLRAATDGTLELLFIKRAEYEGDPWSGHIAFPGGRQEPGDPSLEHTAVRETREELALDLHADGRVLGTLDDLHPRNPALPPIVVRPFVAVVRPDVELVPSDEVALAFWVPVPLLQAPDASVESTIEVRGARWRVPSFVHEGHTIWGMTERILRQLLDRMSER